MTQDKKETMNQTVIQTGGLIGPRPAGVKESVLPTPRFSKLPPERQRQILDAAQEEFGRHGFEKASLNHIIAAADLSKGALYYYFDNKADLYVSVVTRIVDRFPSIIQKIYDVEDPERFWEVAYEAFLEVTRLKLDPATFTILRDLLDPRVASLVPGHLAELMHFSLVTLSRVLETGQRLGVIRGDLPVDFLVYMLQGLMMGISSWLIEGLQEGRRLDPEGYTRFFLELLRRFLDRDQAWSTPFTSFLSSFVGSGEGTKPAGRRPSELSAWLTWSRAGQAPAGSHVGPVPEGDTR